MKKTLAIILTFLFVFLFACNKNGNQNGSSQSLNYSNPPMLTTATTTTMPTTEPVIISEWTTDLLPAEFPAPPEGTYAFEVAKGNHKTDEGNFVSDWVRIRFTCPEQNFHTFTNGMTELGYIGGSKKITDGTFYSSGYQGFWQNGKHLVRINNSYISPSSNLTVTIDIVPVTYNFPAVLSPVFPKFNGITAGTGIYCGHDTNGFQISDSYKGSFDVYWHWEFRFSNRFVGVTLEEFEAYYETLGEMGFSGVISAATVDGCDMLSVDVEKKIDDTEYVCYLLYNQTLRTLDAAYSNDPLIYEMQQNH